MHRGRTSTAQRTYRFTDVKPGAADIILSSTNKWVGVAHKQALASEIPYGSLDPIAISKPFAWTQRIKMCSCNKWHLAIKCDAEDPRLHQQPVNGRFGVRDVIFADLDTPLFPNSHNLIANLDDREELGEEARLSFSKREDAAAFIAANKAKRLNFDKRGRRASHIKPHERKASKKHRRK